MTVIKGVCPVVPTLFNKEEKIDYESMANLTEILIKNGVDGITMFGVGSEFYKLSLHEYEKITDFFIEKVDNRVPTIVNVTDNSTQVACERALSAQQAGASALMLLPPHFVGTDSDSLLRHIKAVIDTVEIPVVIQYAPNETKITIPAETFVRLAEESNDEIYVKVESTPAGPLISHLTENGIKVLTGQGGITFYEGLERGAIGIMPGCSFYEHFISIYSNYLAGNKEKAFKIHNNLLPYLTFIDQDVEMFLAAEKYILKLKGSIENTECRKPNFNLDDVQKEIIEKHYKNLI